ncbi:MAG TPA: CRISPR-associated endonuclease Cas2 [Chloroflexota bacterium]
MRRKRKVLVAYDVSTETPAGQRRLRKVAQVCCGFGVRVQKSVFECWLSDRQQARLLASLLAVINVNEDSLRVYPLPGDDREILVFGVNQQLPLDGLLLV